MYDKGYFIHEHDNVVSRKRAMHDPKKVADVDSTSSVEVFFGADVDPTSPVGNTDECELTRNSAGTSGEIRLDFKQTLPKADVGHKVDVGTTVDGVAIEECQAVGFDIVEFIAFLQWRVAEAEPGSLDAATKTQTASVSSLLTTNEILTEMALRFMQVDAMVSKREAQGKIFGWNQMVDALAACGLLRGVGHFKTDEVERIMSFLVSGRADGKSVVPTDFVPPREVEISIPRLSSLFKKSIFGGPGSASVLLTTGLIQDFEVSIDGR